MKSVVDLSAYDISTDDAVALFSAVAKYYPAEYSLIANSDFTYKIIVSPNLDRIMKIRFYYGDDANLDTYQKRVKDLNAEINALVAKVEGMDEFEKALYIHDYIVLNSEYDLELLEYMEANNCVLPGELRSEKYTEYSILVNGTGVCGSYALAYRAVLNAAGMECLYLSSKQMNHGWNLVKVDGEWYHVDCCWDDPVPDTYGRAKRAYFLRTDEEIMKLNHYSWTPGQYKASSDKYSDMPRDYDIKQKYDDGKWYYLDGSTLYSSDEYGKNETEIASISASSIDVDNGNVYYSTGRYVYEYDIEAKEKVPVYMLSKNDSGDKPEDAYLSNIYVDGENVEFYKSIYSNDKRITAHDTDFIQRDTFNAVTGLEISHSEVSLDVFETLQLSVDIISTSSIEDLEIEWSSSDETVVFIDEKGQITAANTGTSTITAKVLDCSVSCVVTVTGNGLSGMCGDNAYWNIDIANNTLLISGAGDMMDGESEYDFPWHEYKYNKEIHSVTIEEGIKSIGKYAFGGSYIEKISFPTTLTSIDDNAFDSSHSLGYIVIPNNVESIGKEAFYNSDKLKEVYIGDNVSFVGESAFVYCDFLEKITVSIGNKHFTSDEVGCLYNYDKTSLIQYPTNCKNKNYEMPTTVTTICEKTFSNATCLETVTISDKVTRIEENVFSHCKNLKRVNIGKSVEYINFSDIWSAFYGSYGIEFFEVSKDNKRYLSDDFGAIYSKDKYYLYMYPSNGSASHYSVLEGTSQLTTEAFLNCSNLQSVHLSSTVSSMGYPAFYGCESLQEITVDKSNKVYTSLDGCLFDKQMTTIYQYPAGRENTSYSIPDTVTYIRNGCFNYCKNLKVVIIPESVNSIGYEAFCFCSNLLDIKVPKSVNSIDKLAFNDGLTGGKKRIIIENSSCSLHNGPSILGFQPTVFYGHTNSTTADMFPSGFFYSFVDMDKLPHSHEYFLMWHEPATATADGYEYYECYCGEANYTTSLHYYGEETATESTCVLDGSKTQACINCGNVDVLETIPATGKHRYELVSTTPGTCTVAPVNTYECSTCGDTYIKTGKIEDGHNYAKKVVAPTCTEKGYTKEVCTICGETLISDFTSPLGHKLVINRSADYCSAHGTLEYSCKNCDYTESIAADTTDLVTETVTVEPTCTTSGTKSKICTLCGAKASVEILNPLSHDYSDEWIVDTEPTCTEKGSKSKHCTRCDAKREVTVVDEVGHKYHDRWLERNVPTCEKDGLEYRNCYVCNDAEEIRVAGKLGHNYSSDWIVDVEPTCTATGTKSHHCTRCSSKSDVTEVAKLMHSYKSIVTDSTCTVEGYTTHTCTSCGDAYTDSETSALGHKMSAYSVTKQPTCTDKGTEISTCTVCTHTETRTINAKGHNYKDGVCTGCGKNKVENCTHMCHKGGFMGFIWKIIRFFWKLFKMNPVCDCGAKHY